MENKVVMKKSGGGGVLSRQSGIDALKCLCAFLVVCIHKPFPGIVGEYTDVLAKIAVPIFFMISGYYYKSMCERNRLTRHIKKLFVIMVAANCFYFIMDLLHVAIDGGNFSQYFQTTLTFSALLRFVLLNQSPFNGILWYVGAILYVMLIMLVLDKRIDRRRIYWMIPVGLILNLCLGRYSIALLGTDIPYQYSLNWILSGMPFFLLGDLLTDQRFLKYSKTSCALWTLVFSVVGIAEHFILASTVGNGKGNLYISTGLLSVAVFLLFRAVGSDSVAHSSAFYRFCAWIGKKHTLFVYVLHQGIITALSVVMSRVSLSKSFLTIYSWLAPFIIFIMALSISVLLQWLIALIKRKNLGARETVT